MATAVAKLNAKKEKKEVGRSLTALALRRIRRDKLTLIAIGFIIVLALLSYVFAPIISNVLNISYARTDPNATFLPPLSPGHILGTDDLGRDLLARLLYAGQVSLGVGFVAAILALGI